MVNVEKKKANIRNNANNAFDLNDEKKLIISEYSES